MSIKHKMEEAQRWLKITKEQKQEKLQIIKNMESGAEIDKDSINRCLSDIENYKERIKTRKAQIKILKSQSAIYAKIVIREREQIVVLDEGVKMVKRVIEGYKKMLKNEKKRGKTSESVYELIKNRSLKRKCRKNTKYNGWIEHKIKKEK